MSDFRAAYSKLIRACWENPGLQATIAGNPSALKDYGFASVPSKVSFETANGPSTIVGYDDQQDAVDGGDATFYIPPKPTLGAMAVSENDAATALTDACCCCCPCCTCT